MSSDQNPNPEVEELLKELINTVSDDVKEDCGKVSASQPINISSFVEMEGSSFTNQEGESLNSDRIEYIKQQKISNKKRIRSISENESEIDSVNKESIRRKFGSEGQILSLAGIIPPEQRKELNEAIGNYIDKLIKDSIFKAVKSVNVDSLCEDIFKDFSNRKNSLSAEDSEDDFIVEQRLSSNSISELVELENAGDEKKGSFRDSLFPGNNRRYNETGNLDNGLNDADQATFVGYLADLEDTVSIDDLKSAEDSLNSSMSSDSEKKVASGTNNQEHGDNLCETFNANVSVKRVIDDNTTAKDDMTVNSENAGNVTQPKEVDASQTKSNCEKEHTSEQKQTITLTENANEPEKNSNTIKKDEKVQSHEIAGEQDQKLSSAENLHKPEELLPSAENMEKQEQKPISSENTIETVDLIVMSPEEECLIPNNDSEIADNSILPPDIVDTLPQQKISVEEQTKVNWKVGYLQVKLPHKTRGKTHLKAWKKRRVIIQPDEFVNDPKNPSLVISVYGTDSKKHETTFWHSVSSQKAVVFRSSSRTHRYAFTISEGSEPIIHLSSENESTTQEWIASIRAVLWPPSPFMELEKMLSGREFEISFIDNEFSYHAGLLGMYGYLSITPTKLILLHPQQGYVIQEWYLNTVDKFQFVRQPKADDDHKVLCMTTCSDSSTGQGELIFFCNEAVTLLQSLASNIHQVLSYHSKQEGGKYRKELEEIAEWLVAPPQDCLNTNEQSDEHYKVPPRQVKSLLDIPNFIFNKSLSPVASAIYPAPPNSNILEPLDDTKNKPTTTSHDSGISTCTSGEDFLNCSVTSFVIGGGPMTGKSSDSELSDAYSPPRTPEIKKKSKCEVLREEQLPATEA